MKQINPLAKMGHMSKDPHETALKTAKYKERGRKMVHDIVKFRLYHGDEPTGKVVECNPMEATAWNRNAAAYFAWQASLGREHLPMLEWKKETDGSRDPLWDVHYKENGQVKQRRVYGATKAAAKREFEAVTSLGARVLSVEEPDVQPAQGDWLADATISTSGADGGALKLDAAMELMTDDWIDEENYTPDTVRSLRDTLLRVMAADY